MVDTFPDDNDRVLLRLLAERAENGTASIAKNADFVSLFFATSAFRARGDRRKDE